MHKVVEGLAGLAQTKARLGLASPQVSIWWVATRENLAELPDLVRLAARVGVPEVYLQRMVFFAGDAAEQYGMARHDLAIFDSALSQQDAIIAECEALSAGLGIAFHASGARDLRNSLAAQRPAASAPWRACMRPWTTAYVTANGNCLPCCISPFSTADYDSLILGNLFKRPFAEIWNDAAYRAFRTRLLSTEPNRSVRELWRILEPVDRIRETGSGGTSEPGRSLVRTLPQSALRTRPGWPRSWRIVRPAPTRSWSIGRCETH